MRLPGPTDLLALAGRGFEAAEKAIALVPRLVVIVGEVEQLMATVRKVVADIQTVQTRAAAVVGRTETVVTRAETVVGRTEKLTAALTPLLDRFQPTLDKLEPMVAHLAATTSPVEIDAIVKLVDTLPDVAAKMQTDILPILDTLGTVAPDLRDLLDVSRELNEILGAVPGLGRIKKRIEERQEQEDEARADEYRANEIPPAEPARQN
ncbi:ABC-type transporter Mla subunit MlaD [Nakamurella sp. UYEF19]|uniref:hypothetical protein n=1 Tax=Nakamurella sp. UYEF19 TaxID=1756392 RepID=UPI00339A8028